MVSLLVRQLRTRLEPVFPRPLVAVVEGFVSSIVLYCAAYTRRRSLNGYSSEGFLLSALDWTESKWLDDDTEFLLQSCPRWLGHAFDFETFRVRNGEWIRQDKDRHRLQKLNCKEEKWVDIDQSSTSNRFRNLRTHYDDVTQQIFSLLSDQFGPFEPPTKDLILRIFDCKNNGACRLIERSVEYHPWLEDAIFRGRMPNPDAAIAYDSVAERLYFLGGSDVSGHGCSNMTTLDLKSRDRQPNIQLYNFSHRLPCRLTKATAVFRRRHNQIFLIGGQIRAGDQIRSLSGTSCRNVWTFDTRSERWDVDDQIRSGRGTSCRNVWTFDTSTERWDDEDKWPQLAQLTGRHSAWALLIDDDEWLVLIGGFSGSEPVLSIDALPLTADRGATAWSTRTMLPVKADGLLRLTVFPFVSM